MPIERIQKRYGIGVDTGGTFTDAVLLDLDSQQILKTSKRPTTHYNLSHGVLAALTDVLADLEGDAIANIAFSTTLATNAIAEGHGARVGLVVIGPVKPFDLPVVSVRYLDGGHNHLGVEVKPLEIERVTEAIIELKDHVDAYAIAASMSIANPSHELLVAKAIELLDPKPVFCSHQISQKSGIMERTATAVFHARLMPILMDFVSHLKQLTVEKRIAADIKIIRGDATAVDLDQAVSRAAQTVASGPAATAYFGATSVADKTALIVDVGGTTTDISLVEQGRPVISTSGSLIDRWLTHVDAIKTHTVGIGGDSQVKIDRSAKLTIGPGRVQSLAMSNGIADPESWMGIDNHGRYLLRPGVANDNRESRDPVLNHLRKGGAGFGELMEHTGMSELSLDRRIEELVFQRQVVEIGFTPTDALHVLGALDFGDAAISAAGAGVLAKMRNQSVEAFCKEVVFLTQKKIADAIIAFLFAQVTGGETVPLPLLEEKNALFSTLFRLNIYIVGIGAAAGKLLPEVAKRFETPIVFPLHYEVGNAVGAIMIASRKG
jgi:N-methylhydantoinase A/oxoprolinase/acetone carboxylase beta subunit